MATLFQVLGPVKWLRVSQSEPGDLVCSYPPRLKRFFSSLRPQFFTHLKRNRFSIEDNSRKLFAHYMINFENPLQLNFYASFLSHLSMSRLLKTLALFKRPAHTPPAPVFSLLNTEPLSKLLWLAKWISADDKCIIDSVKCVPHLKKFK